MIERHESEGFTAAYMDRNWRPVDADKAEFVKLVYDDGRIAFLIDPAPQRIRIYGASLAVWAKAIIAQDYARILSALNVGLSAGESNTEIAHRVVGSLDMNGTNGMTEVTRQHILSLGKGYLRRR